MGQKQYILILACGLLFGLVYFGMNTKAPEQKAAEMTRSVNIETTGIQNLLAEARGNLSKGELSLIDAYMNEYNKAEEDSIKVGRLVDLSSSWYRNGEPVIAGYYAEEVAKIKNDHDSWAIAGTTYSIGMKEAKEEKNLLYARSRAINALEKAISIEPDNISDQVNLSLIYVERPDTNPMQGILMLRELNEKHPKDVSVLNQLAKLAIRTNQFDKAIERLSSALELEPNNKNSICLIADAYQQMGETALAVEYKEKCIK